MYHNRIVPMLQRFIAPTLTALLLLALLVGCVVPAPAETTDPAAEATSAPEEEAAGTECEEGFRPYEHTAGVTCVPEDPQRVVTLQDQNAMLPLWELGFRNIIGSVGALDGDGERYFRRMAEHGYDPTGVEWISEYGEPNLEAITALEPDLIVGQSYQEEIYDLLSEIAPTVLIDPFDGSLQEVMLRYGELVGLEDEVERLEADYQRGLADLREAAGDPNDVVISVIVTAASGGAQPGQFYVSGPFGAVEGVLREAGFARPAPQLEVEERTYYSVESLPEHDADLLMRITFRQNADEEEENTRAVKESALWDLLNAVQKDQAVDINGEATIGTGYSPRLTFIETLMGLLENLDTSGDLPQVDVATPTPEAP